MPSPWDVMQNQAVAEGTSDPTANIPTSPEEAEAMGFTPEQYDTLQGMASEQMARTGPPTTQASRAEDLAKTYELKHRDLLNQQQLGVKQLSEQVNQYAQQPTEFDNRPLLGLADMFASGENYSGRLGRAPSETKAQRDEKLMGLRMGLQQRREGLSKSELEGLKAQIDAYKSMQVKQKDPLMDELRRSQIRANNVAAGLKANPEPKDFQAQAATFGKRAEQAEAIFRQLKSQGYNRGTRSESARTLLPGEMQSGSLKQQEQAERNFVNAILRRESGATITSSEFDSAAQQYFPRPGDTAEVLAQKEQNRLQAVEGMKVTAGHAWSKIGNAPGVAPRPSGPKPGSVVDGYEFIGGNPADKNSWRKK